MMCHMIHSKSQLEIVPIEVLAKRLRLSKAFLKRETQSGRIPSLKAGNQIRYNPNAVISALAAQATSNVSGGQVDE